jgi:serine/threonine protein kinase
MQLAPGDSLAQYRVVSVLGSGAMGAVFRGADTRLNRSVAIKVPSPESTSNGIAKRRFLDEARAASALDHPNICTVYEVSETHDGDPYIVMAYCNGETLKDMVTRGPLEERQTIDLGMQILQGLSAAHRAGVVHRDIKPANIMVTVGGLVKLLDFGIAKLQGSEGPTQTGSVLCTAAYMSPEQAAGLEVDHRTDIWSFGVTLYQMLTGELPFEAGNVLALSELIRESEPRSVRELDAAVSSEIEHIVSRCLAKDRDERYQSAADVLAEFLTLLEQRSTQRHASRVDDSSPSVAVLPFSNMIAEGDQDYFCEGITEEIINALTKLEGLRVSSRTVVRRARESQRDACELGRSLQVQSVLEGSVRISGNRMRVIVKLVSVVDGYHLWSERYDREMSDVFDIQDDIARSVSEALRVRLLDGQLVPRVPRVELGTYLLDLQRKHYWATLLGRDRWNGVIES